MSLFLYSFSLFFVLLPGPAPSGLAGGVQFWRQELRSASWALVVRLSLSCPALARVAGGVRSAPPRRAWPGGVSCPFRC